MRYSVQSHSSSAMVIDGQLKRRGFGGGAGSSGEADRAVRKKMYPEKKPIVHRTVTLYLHLTSNSDQSDDTNR